MHRSSHRRGPVFALPDCKGGKRKQLSLSYSFESITDGTGWPEAYLPCAVLYAVGKQRASEFCLAFQPPARQADQRSIPMLAKTSPAKRRMMRIGWWLNGFQNDSYSGLSTPMSSCQCCSRKQELCDVSNVQLQLGRLAGSSDIDQFFFHRIPQDQTQVIDSRFA